MSSHIQPPEKPKLDHLTWLTTADGILQHTKKDVHSLEHGYATDDNARALMVVIGWKYLLKDRSALNLDRYIDIYLTAIERAHYGGGEFSCYLDINTHKVKAGEGDWNGRAFHALAFAHQYSQDLGTVQRAEILLNQVVPYIQKKKTSMRTIAFLLCGYWHLKNHPVGQEIFKEATLRSWKKLLINNANNYSSKSWVWPEPIIAYDNGKIIQEYLLLGTFLNDKQLLRWGKRFLDFYIKLTFKKGYFQAPGNRGFWTKNSRPLHAEQSLEVYSVIAALMTGHRTFQDKNYKKEAVVACEWFFGRNRLAESVIDLQKHWVFDGIEEHEVSLNRGSESALSWYLAYLSLTQNVLF